MKLIDLVTSRQSTRNYSSTPVPRQMIDQCIDTARLAPSACNSQPWSFIVIDDPELKDTLAHHAFSGIYSVSLFAKKAPVIIAAITEQSSYMATLGRFIKGTQYNLIDIGIACEHFILQATELGIGTCWIGWFNERGVKKALSLPRKTKIDVLISVGYSEDPVLREKTRKTLNDIRHFNIP